MDDWPEFSYQLEKLKPTLYTFAERVGRVSGMLDAMPENIRMDAVIATMVSEAVKTSEIEGEYISREDVMSSIRNNMGLNRQPERVRDQRAAGIAELMLNIRDTFADPLSKDKLFEWHKMLMKGNQYVGIGKWRIHKEAMQIISGPMGKEKVHFEAPPSESVPKEMQRFIKWFNKNNTSKYPPIKAAIAHLYFESIHPFEDGNGRIGRAISEKALSQSLGRPVLLSLSQTIEADKKSYYNALHEASRSNEITPWLEYFVPLILEAQISAEEYVGFIVKKAHFFDKHGRNMNERQLKVVQRMLEEGPAGFKGGMNARKYVGITGVSKATATRDMQLLVESGVFLVSGTGRGTRYHVNMK